MNVNPFSYLIEKLKGFVSKSGDTMSGNLTVDRRNGTAGTEGYSGIILGNNVPYTQNENSTGYARFFTKNGYSIDVYAKHAPNNNQEIILPESDGTLALKSDIYNRQFLGTINEGQSISIPDGYHNIYLRCDINSYFYGPTYSSVIVPYLEIPFPIGDTWVGTERLTYDGGTKKLTYYSESTVFGSKPGTWTTNIAVWYD